MTPRLGPAPALYFQKAQEIVGWRMTLVLCHHRPQHPLSLAGPPELKISGGKIVHVLKVRWIQLGRALHRFHGALQITPAHVDSTEVCVRLIALRLILYRLEIDFLGIV